MRWVICLSAAFVGCVVSIPSDEAELAAELATGTARIVVVQRARPDSKPDAGDRCENCAGEGRVGDGTVFVTCPVCRGTGRKTKP